MLSLGTKSLLGLGAALLAASVVYGVASSEGSGTALLAFAAIGAFALAMVAVSSGPDRPPVPDGGGAAAGAQSAPVGGRPLLPSIWPLGGGVAIGALALASATSGVIVVAAVLAAVAVLLGWVFQAWTEHPAFTARFGGRLSDRVLVPLGLPVAVFALVATIALSLSRVLLAAPEVGSRVVAIVIAVVIMAGAFIVVSQERMARAALSLLSATALVAVVAAGAVGLAHGERKFEKKGSNGHGTATIGAPATATATTTTTTPPTPPTTAEVTAGFATTATTVATSTAPGAPTAAATKTTLAPNSTPTTTR